VSESIARQKLAYTVDITRGANENWPPHVVPGGRGKLTRYHVAAVRVRVEVTMEVLGSEVRARFRSRGVRIMRGARIRADGTHGAPIGTGHYWRPRKGNAGGWARVRQIEAAAVDDAARLYREAFALGSGLGAPVPWVDAGRFTRTDLEELATRGPDGEPGQDGPPRIDFTAEHYTR
jgi:hypothetical protein